jgi:hypothetical protein
MEQSIKARVSALAQEDPFLTVKNLAKEAGTTTPYVRTILSEAGLSLNEMRRLYARRLEQSAGAVKSAAGIEEVQAELTITTIEGDKTAVREWAEQTLFLASRVERRQSLTSFVQLITPHRLTVETAVKNMRDLLPPACRKGARIARQEAQVLPAPKRLDPNLDWPPASQVLKLTTLLTCDQEPLALEVKWLALDGLVLTWSHLEPEVVIQVGS